eukprot:TRINITY_DN104319_c0_g1_i1.p1 TRINITY_DN104319_c0_g1~~TRINITY_DN104319_c0_g1_i1.p1  ORF type:complete len:398 (-),score=72.16 TRINITY_DN104319_c0_g1_i1:50-1243(-)
MSDCYVIKLLMLGDGTVGKSQLLIRYVDARFVQNFIVSIGVDTRQKTTVHKGNKVKVQVWDAAGNKDFQTVTPDYYKAAHGVIIVYDITNETSFASVEHWYQEVQKYCALKTPVIVVGNKTDSVDEHTSSLRIPREKEEEMSAKLGVTLFAASAKNGSGVEEAFSAVIDQVFLDRFVPNGAVLIESELPERATGFARLWPCFHCRHRPLASAPVVQVSTPPPHLAAPHQVQPPPTPADMETSISNQTAETGNVDAGTLKNVEMCQSEACDEGSAKIDTACGADKLSYQDEAAASPSSRQDEKSSSMTPRSNQLACPEPSHDQAVLPFSQVQATKELEELLTMHEDTPCQSTSKTAESLALIQAQGQSISNPCQIFVDLLCSPSCNHNRAERRPALPS